MTREAETTPTPEEPTPVLARLVEQTVANFLGRTHRDDGAPYCLEHAADDAVRDCGQSPIALITPILQQTRVEPHWVIDLELNGQFTGTWEDFCLALAAQVVTWQTDQTRPDLRELAYAREDAYAAYMRSHRHS